MILLIVGTPLAWWLARTRSRLKPLWLALVAMPIVLPPTVIGFYLLLLMGPQGPVGQLTQALGLGRLPFTFAGLVVASVLYSMPFVVQPLQQAFEAIPERTLEAAATLRAGAAGPLLQRGAAAGAARACSRPACSASRIPWASSAWC